MPSVVNQMSKTEIDRLYERCRPFIRKEKKPQYAYWQIWITDCSITAYRSGKVVYSGADVEWARKEPEKKTKEVFPQAGSDEVGTGDYFGPVVVAACIIEPEEEKYLRDLGVQDSKKISDPKIREMAVHIKEHTKYSISILPNEKYNSIHHIHNANSVKAFMHNQAYINLKRKGYDLPEQIIIDQFTPEETYYGYLSKNGKPEEIIRGIIFETKGESKYLSVACASILARNAFLEYYDKMKKKYGFEFPKGAGPGVDEFGRALVKKYGKDILEHIAKYDFGNTEKILKK